MTFLMDSWSTSLGKPRVGPSRSAIAVWDVGVYSMQLAMRMVVSAIRMVVSIG